MRQSINSLVGATHATLDHAAWAAYGWEDDPNEATDAEILGRLLELNQQHATVSGA